MAKIIAIDSDIKMIEYANKHNNHDSIDYIVHDIEKDIDGSSIEKFKGNVSLIFSNYCFQWILDKKRLMNNIRQLLKPDSFVYANIFMLNSLKLKMGKIEKVQLNIGNQILEWKTLLNQLHFKIIRDKFSIKDFVFNREVYEKRKYINFQF